MISNAQSHLSPIRQLQSEIGVSEIAPSEIPGLWSEIKPRIEKVLDIDKLYRIEDIYRALKDGNYILWIVRNIEVIVVLNIIDYGLKRVLVVFLVSGENRQQWMNGGIKLLKHYGKYYGCNEIHVCGRKAWVRLLKPHGFEVTDYNMRLPI